MGLEFRAVLGGCVLGGVFFVGGQGVGGGGDCGRGVLWRWRFGGGGGGNLPSLRDDDVVEGGVAFAEAGEADFDNHCWLSTNVEREREREAVFGG